ncbi:MAG: tRNA (adenosine(37)-N6)-threonylcarbamoyltransferase complex dimerization subunit type 1 TsaB [Pseudomonadota bacterium]
MLLAVDTSGPHCTVALADRDSGELITSSSEELGRGHAERLMAMIGEVIGEASAGYADLTAIGCTIGPGSFTGLRVGMAAAKGLALAAGIPCIGVTVFDAMRADVAEEPVAITLDAKRGEIWLQWFGDGPGEPMALPPGHAAQDIPDGITRLVGSGASIVADAAQQIGRTDLTVVEGNHHVTPHGLAAACLAAPEQQDPIRPLYLRAPDAKPQADVALAGIVKAGAA